MTFLSLEIGIGVTEGVGVGIGVAVGVSTVFTEGAGDDVTTALKVGAGVDIITSSGVDKDGVGMGSFTYIRGMRSLFTDSVLHEAKLTLIHLPDKKGSIKPKRVKDKT